MTYLQQTLVNAIHEAAFCGRTASNYANKGRADLAFMWGRFAATNATTALLILEHELTDDVTADGVRDGE